MSETGKFEAIRHRGGSRAAIARITAALMLVCLPQPALPVSPAKQTGAISGTVKDGTGVPQMGAAVLLYDRQERFFQKVFTDDRGRFSFPDLVPSLYSVHVTLTSFIPAIKKNIMVEPGVRSLLNVNLATLFSSIQMVYSQQEATAFMSDDWKWVLRSASSTRPVMRLLPRIGLDPDPTRTRTAFFSDTRGMLKLAAGDGSDAPTFANGPDLGTEFAVATSLRGSSQLLVSGKVGYAPTGGTPTAAFRTKFSRDLGIGSPEISVTMRQLAMPSRMIAGLGGSDVGLPALRSLSISFDDKTQLSDSVRLQYGFAMDSVTFLDHLSYFSPYARLTYSVDKNSSVELTYTSGNARPELGMSQESGLQQDMRSLAYFPRVSLRDGRAKVQRGQDYEISYNRNLGSRSVKVTGYRETISNLALTMSGPADLFGSGDLLPDLFSGSSIFNAGGFETAGYTISGTQNFGDEVSATVTYGSVGALAPSERQMETNSPDELRSLIRASRKHAVTARVAATSPVSGTHFVASYQWADARYATPGHIYSTQTARPEPGFNLYIRQPIPNVFSLPWRMEITADLRNLLAQGYLPLNTADGRRLLLVQTPRAFRGGLSFIF